MNYVHPEYLIEVEQLHALLEDENVRIFDASVAQSGKRLYRRARR